MNFNASGYLQPVSFLFLRKDPNTGEKVETPLLVLVAPESLRSGAEKEAYTRTLRKMHKKNDGLAVILVMEAWVASVNLASREQLNEWRANHDGSIEDFPGRQEKVLITLKHEALQQGKMWWADIHRPESDVSGVAAPPFLGQWHEMPEDTRTNGRFFGFFKPTWSAKRKSNSN